MRFLTLFCLFWGEWCRLVIFLFIYIWILDENRNVMKVSLSDTRPGASSSSDVWSLDVIKSELCFFSNVTKKKKTIPEFLQVGSPPSNCYMFIIFHYVAIFASFSSLLSFIVVFYFNFFLFHGCRRSVPGWSSKWLS